MAGRDETKWSNSQLDGVSMDQWVQLTRALDRLSEAFRWREGDGVQSGYATVRRSRIESALSSGIGPLVALVLAYDILPEDIPICDYPKHDYARYGENNDTRDYVIGVYHDDVRCPGSKWLNPAYAARFKNRPLPEGAAAWMGGGWDGKGDRRPHRKLTTRTSMDKAFFGPDSMRVVERDGRTVLVFRSWRDRKSALLDITAPTMTANGNAGSIATRHTFSSITHQKDMAIETIYYRWW
jgi:hypothetical protein